MPRYTQKMREMMTESIRNDVCSTGIDLLCEGGWEAFTTENIARRLNVSRGVLYNYFRDKNDILYAIARSSISDLCDNLEKIASDGRTSSERMLAMAEFIVRTFHEKRKYHRAIMENVPPPKDSSHPVILGDKRRTAIFEGVLRDGIAHIDAAYGGEDYTAFTCGKRVGDKLYMYGRLWPRHVDTVLDAALTECDRLMCAPIYCETNGDKGYLAREIVSRGARAGAYTERQNKYYKISNALHKWWGAIVFLAGTDRDYINQIMDYTEDAEHDDAPDSAACVCRTLDNGYY